MMSKLVYSKASTARCFCSCASFIILLSRKENTLELILFILQGFPLEAEADMGCLLLQTFARFGEYQAAVTLWYTFWKPRGVLEPEGIMKHSRAAT